MKTASVAICLVTFLAGCVHQTEPFAETAAPITCEPPPHSEVIWAQQHLHYVLLGENHGTAETPAVFAELVCAAATTGKRILVGLEFAESVRPAFQTYVASDGTTEDISDFLTDSGWLVMARQFADGRTSNAMWKMVERLRALRAQGLHVSLTTFQRPIGGETQTPYEIGMAMSLQEAAPSGVFDLIIVLVGSLHARKTAFNPKQAGLHGLSPFDPMAMHLPQESTLSLRVINGGGEAWSCRPDCGVGPLTGSPGGASPGVVIDPAFHLGYDGVVAVGSVSASPPLLEVPR